MRPMLAFGLAAVLALACTACQDYLARRDTLTLGSGEAVQANIAKQVIDPWSPGSDRIDFSTDGHRMANAVERYRNPVVGSGIAVLPPVPLGPPNVPSVSAPAVR